MNGITLQPSPGTLLEIIPVASHFKIEAFSDDDFNDAVDAPPVLEATPYNGDELMKCPGAISRVQERSAKKPSLSSIFIEQPVWLRP